MPLGGGAGNEFTVATPLVEDDSVISWNSDTGAMNCTLDELWRINVGSGFSAPPMAFEVDSKQYRDRFGTSPGSRQRLANTPELQDMRHAHRVVRVFAGRERRVTRRPACRAGARSVARRR
jgi:hypothetical protein